MRGYVVFYGLIRHWSRWVYILRDKLHTFLVNAKPSDFIAVAVFIWWISIRPNDSSSPRKAGVKNHLLSASHLGVLLYSSQDRCENDTITHTCNCTLRMYYSVHCTLYTVHVLVHCTLCTVRACASSVFCQLVICLTCAEYMCMITLDFWIVHLN